MGCLFSGLRGDVLGGVISNFMKGLWVGFKWFSKVVFIGNVVVGLRWFPK
jgi:hypothetical protein